MVVTNLGLNFTTQQQQQQQQQLYLNTILPCCGEETLLCVRVCMCWQGYTATTVEQFLHQFPVQDDDIVHVEDGGWVNPDGDFGSPQSLKWNWPLIPNNAQVKK